MVPEVQLQSADLKLVRCDPAEEQLVRPLWTGLLLQDRGPQDQLPGPGESQAPKKHTIYRFNILFYLQNPISSSNS